MYEGTSYYWRGAATTNYLKFGGYCWRIVRINGDGTIRLIYDGTTCHNNGESTTESIAVQNVAYNTNRNKSEYVGWTYTEGLQRPTNNDEGVSSNAKTKLEEWYNTNLKSQESKIADGKYCNDRNVQSGQSWGTNGSSFDYSARVRRNEKISTLSCSNNDIYLSKVAFITSDEVMYAGGSSNDNKKYYLYNGQDYWTMSPYSWYGPSSEAAMLFVNSYGLLHAIYLNIDYGVRPVINLNANIKLSGNGTINDPYEVI